MSNASGYVLYLREEVLRHIDGLTVRSMFGGYGLYRHGVIFGIVANDTLYFKADAQTLPDFEAYASKPFTYTGHKGKTYAMSYFEVPGEVLENTSLVAEWVEKAVCASQRAKLNKRTPH